MGERPIFFKFLQNNTIHGGTVKSLSALHGSFFGGNIFIFTDELDAIHCHCKRDTCICPLMRRTVFVFSS